MKIELIGCTSTGKSTLAKKLLAEAASCGINLQLGDDFVLQQFLLGKTKNSLLRTIFVDVFSFTYSIINLPNHFHYYRFAFRRIHHMSIPRIEKLNLIRNIFKKIGIDEIIRRHKSQDQYILLDEGTLHAAHNLFVTAEENQPAYDISEFTRLIPFPDVAIYLKQDEATIVARTLKRGHKRIPSGSHSIAKRFIHRAVSVFEKLTMQPELNGKLITIANMHKIDFPEGIEDRHPICPLRDLLNRSFTGSYHPRIEAPGPEKSTITLKNAKRF